MTRLIAVTGIVALAVAFDVSGAVGGVPSTSASGTEPSLRVTSLSPFTVAGARFQPSERVQLSLGASNSIVVRVRASARGIFTTRFQGAKVQRCDGYLVRATGSKGSTATARARPLMCPSINPDG